jgi:hypothetical protein
MLWKRGNVRVTKGAELLGRFKRTEMSDRQFCLRCGGHLMTDHPTLGLTDVRAGVIAGLAFKPEVHLNYAETVLPIKDGLPKLRDFPAAAGGSGEFVPE